MERLRFTTRPNPIPSGDPAIEDPSVGNGLRLPVLNLEHQRPQRGILRRRGKPSLDTTAISITQRRQELPYCVEQDVNSNTDERRPCHHRHDRSRKSLTAQRGHQNFVRDRDASQHQREKFVVLFGTCLDRELARHRQLLPKSIGIGSGNGIDERGHAASQHVSNPKQAPIFVEQRNCDRNWIAT